MHENKKKTHLNLTGKVCGPDPPDCRLGYFQFQQFYSLSLITGYELLYTLRKQVEVAYNSFCT